MASLRSLGLSCDRIVLVACLLAGCGGGGKMNADGGATGRGGTTGSGGAGTGAAGSGAAGSGAGGNTGTGGGGTAGATGSGGTGADCTATACAGLAYCDLASHQCKPGCAFNSQCASTQICDVSAHQCKTGCASDSQCGANQTCDLTAQTCGCSSGFHSCSNACVSNTSTDTCGQSCSPCAAAPTNGTVTCSSSGTCGFKCNSSYFLCGSNCYPGTGMDQNVCGTSCAPCAVKANATAKCSSGTCSYTCATGYSWGPSCQRCYMYSGAGDTCTTTADCCPADSERVCVSGHCIVPYESCNYTVTGQCQTGTSCQGPPGGFGLCAPACKTAADCPPYSYETSTHKAECDGSYCYFYCSMPSDCPPGLNSCGSGRCL